MPDGLKTYLFKVRLQWMPGVWRTIEVREDQTLHHLHRAIQRAFNWDDDHLYSFFLSGKPGTGRLSTPARTLNEGAAPGSRSVHLGLRPRQRFLYLFDYGDDLRHDVELLSINDHPDPVRYPRILEVQGEAPPQYPGLEEEDWEEEGE